MYLEQDRRLPIELADKRLHHIETDWAPPITSLLWQAAKVLDLFMQCIQGI